MSNWEIFINYLNNNQGLMVSINLLATILIFGGILFITIKYANSTERLATKTAESVDLTKEKVKKDRTLSFIEKIDPDRYSKLNRLKFVDYPSKALILEEGIEWAKQDVNFNPEAYKKLKQRVESLNFLNEFSGAEQEIIYFLNLFDTISIFYNENELNKKLFDSKLKLLFLNFFINFIDEIVNIMNNYINYENLYNRYDNYLDVIEKIYENHKPPIVVLKDYLEKCRKTKLFLENLNNKKL